MRLKIQRLISGFLAQLILLVVLFNGIALLLPATARAADSDFDSYNMGGDYSINYRFDRDQLYIRTERKFSNAVGGSTDYFYKTKSAQYSTSGAPGIATFETSNGGETLTLNICDPNSKHVTFILPEDGRAISRPTLHKESVANFKDLAGKVSGYDLWDKHKALILGHEPCPKTGPNGDLTPLTQRKVSAIVDLNPDNHDSINSDQEKNDYYLKTNDSLLTKDLLSKLYFCITRDGEQVTIHNGAPACHQVKGVGVQDLLDDNGATQISMSWATPYAYTGNYRLRVLGLESSQFNRPFNFKEINSEHKDSLARSDGDLDVNFTQILFEARKNLGSFNQAVNTYRTEISNNQALQEFQTAEGSNSEEDSKSCESEGGDLSWILCPIIFLADGVINSLDSAIGNVLQVPNKYFENEDEGSSAKKLEETWAKLRNIAYIILVPIILVMVISTALGFEFVSAYTVKRTLPRFIAAIFFIALSWDITKFLVVMTNDVGSGLYGLITASFTDGGTDITLARILSPDGGDSAIGFTGLVAGVGAGIAVLSIGVILSYALVSVVALLIGFTLLSFRQMLIIALMLLAPLAILAWIFPGNDKLWKLWWGSFTKLLLLYPIIIVLIAMGKSFAYVVGFTDSSIISTFIKVAAYIGPYFFIPAAFKYAGGVFGNLAGMVNNRQRGLFDRQKKYRGEKMSHNWQKTKAGNRFGAEHGLLNRTLQRATRPDSFMPGRLGAKGRSVLSTTMSSQTNQGAKMLQELGLQDDAAGNEFIQHGTSIAKLNARVRQLKAEGKGDLANQLSAYSQFAGNRQAILGAMKLNAGFGKLADGSLKQLDNIFGNSSADQAAKQAAFGDLIFTSKNAGNYMTYSSRIVGNKVKTYSDADYQATARQNMSKALLDAGPNELSRIKPYNDMNSGINTKDAAALAVVEGAVNNWGALNQAQQGRAMENLAMYSAQGAYNDPNMKAAFDQAMNVMTSDQRAQYNNARANIMRSVPRDADGNPII